MLVSIEDLFSLKQLADAVGVNPFGPDVYTQPYGPGGVSPAQASARLLREITPSGRAAKLEALLKNRGVALHFSAPEAGSALLQWYELPAGAKLPSAARAKASAVLVASGRGTFKAAGMQAIELKLTVAGKRLLEHETRLKLSSLDTFTPAYGRAVSVSKTFVLEG